MGDTQLERAKRLLMNVEKDVVESLAEWIKEHGGIIKIVNDDYKDNIYGYVWVDDYNSSSPVEEKYINCIRVDEKNAVWFHTCDYETDDWDEFSEIENDDNWYFLDYGSECLLVPTLNSILDAIDEYVEEN